MKNSLLHRSVLAVTLLALTGGLGLAQSDKSKGSLDCQDNWNSGRRASHCEIKEVTLSPTGTTISVDAGQNGGVSVKGWDRNEILVRARVQTGAPTQSEAESLAQQIRIETVGKIYSTGPERRDGYNWSVSYEVFVPSRSDLSLQAHNGGIVISDVHGKIEFNGLNGGVVLRRVGGSVRGGTTNGGLVVELSGDRWDGEELDVKTTNGGIVMSVPDNYSAHLQTATVNGNISIDFPEVVHGKSKQLAVNLGSGGAIVRAVTTNGGVKIKRTSMAF